MIAVGNKKGLTLLAGVLLGVLPMVGCKDKENTDFHGTLIIKLVDAPAALDNLDIVFSRVSIHRAGSAEDLGWRVVSDDILSQDILKLRNGNSRNIVSVLVPEGSYDKIRVLFDISSLTETGIPSTVYIPDDILSGVDFEHVFEVAEGKTTGITFDFDATRSIRTNALGRYELRPIVRIQNTDLAGSIVGAVLPDSVRAIISTSTSDDSVTTISLAQPTNNSFELVDLPEGTYEISIIPTDTLYLAATVSGVVVIRRQKTNIGALSLQLR